MVAGIRVKLKASRRSRFMPLKIVRQDITKMQVDAIVNTTNRKMIGYSGVDLAVHTLAGAGFDEECRRNAPLQVGHAAITNGYALPCKYVIHTVSPIWRGGMLGETALLRACYRESLQLAVRCGCLSVAFPLIGSGANKYPKDCVLQFAVQTITEFLLEHELTVFLCVFDKESYAFSKKIFDDITDFIGSEKEEAPAEKMPMQLGEYLKQVERSFQQLLFAHIDACGMSDVECYKKANVAKQTFSKIKSDPKYHPTKQTAVAFAMALELDLEKTQELLASVGYTLSKSNTFDMIIRYFIDRKQYNVFDANEVLFEFDQKLLGTY